MQSYTYTRTCINAGLFLTGNGLLDAPWHTDRNRRCVIRLFMFLKNNLPGFFAEGAAVPHACQYNSPLDKKWQCVNIQL
jgi:hypothetical protein